MTPETESPPSAATEAMGQKDIKLDAQNPTPAPRAPQVKPGTKLHKVLAALARGGSYNRFQAESELRDHVLPSTVAKIENLGIVVARRTEIVPGHAGSRVACARYWLEPGERDKAMTLLGWKS